MDPYGIATLDYTQADQPLAGPLTDGTYSYPDAAQPSNQPWDSGAPATGGYSADVLNLFKFGVNAWSQNKARNDLLDYKRFEATQGGLFRQGAPANLYTTASGATNPAMIWAAVAIVGVLLFTAKG